MVRSSTMALRHYGTTTLWHYCTIALWHYWTTAIWHYCTTALPGVPGVSRIKEKQQKSAVLPTSLMLFFSSESPICVGRWGVCGNPDKVIVVGDVVQTDPGVGGHKCCHRWVLGWKKYILKYHRQPQQLIQWLIYLNWYAVYFSPDRNQEWSQEQLKEMCKHRWHRCRWPGLKIQRNKSCLCGWCLNFLALMVKFSCIIDNLIWLWKSDQWPSLKRQRSKSFLRCLRWLLLALIMTWNWVGVAFES